MLELKNISKTFNAGTVNQKVALNGLNLTMNEGDFVTVIGGNGAGKSHHAQRHRRSVAGGHRENPHRRRGRDRPAGV